MLTGNLATRPFYNERLATLAIVVLTLLVVGLTAYNGWALVTLSRERGEYRGRIERDEREAARLRAAAASTERSIDSRGLDSLAASAREANGLIDQRTFSWTTFFSRIERTLPRDVRLVVVSPRVERGVFHVDMTVVARDLADIDAFCQALQETGEFYDVAPTDQRPLDNGSFSAAIDASYLSGLSARPAQPPAPATPASAARPPRS